jgi:hypothetical protein
VCQRQFQNPDVHTVIHDSVALATFFHTYGIRTHELAEIAKLQGLTIKHLPKYVDVRWTEFTYRLLSNRLYSWRAIVACMKSMMQTDSAAKGHLAALTDETKLKTTCLVADIRMLYSRFQKSIQDNDLTLLQLSKEVEDVKKSIKDLHDNPLAGGRESTCCSNIASNGEIYNVQLATRNRRREKHHQFVSDRRDYAAIRNEVILSLLIFWMIDSMLTR